MNRVARIEANPGFAGTVGVRSNRPESAPLDRQSVLSEHAAAPRFRFCSRVALCIDWLPWDGRQFTALRHRMPRAIPLRWKTPAGC